MRPHWDDALGALEELDAEVRSDGGELLMLLFPRIDQVAREREGRRLTADFRAPQEFLTAWSAAAGIAVRDMLLVLVSAAEDPLGEVAFGHPSVAGYAVVAGAVAEDVRAILERGDGVGSRSTRDRR